MTQPFTHVPDMDEVRANVLERIVAKLKLRDELMHTTQMLAAHANVNALINPGRRHIKGDVDHLMGHVDLLHSVVEDDIWPDVQQFAFLFARDVLVPDVQANGGGSEPIVMLTGNNYAPAYRSFGEIEEVWQADDEGTYIGEMWELIERKCLELDVIVTGHPDDNSIYGVDLRKWEPSEATEKDETIEDLSDEWTWIDPTPDTTSADVARGYVLDVEALASAVLATVEGDFKLVINQRVKFTEPDRDTDVHTIAAIGRDSDNDVWVKLDSMDASPIFEWAEVLAPVED